MPTHFKLFPILEQQVGRGGPPTPSNHLCRRPLGGGGDESGNSASLFDTKSSLLWRFAQRDLQSSRGSPALLSGDLPQKREDRYSQEQHQRCLEHRDGLARRAL